MATVTPNYNWPVPTSTDFVKDGADSIKDLGDAIDATVFALPSGALTLISATTVGSAVASVTVSDCFSATYQNYRITYTGGVASVGATNFNFKGSGVTGTPIIASGDWTSSAGTTGSLDSAGNSVFICMITGTGNLTLQLDVYRPFESTTTSIIGRGVSFTPAVAMYQAVASGFDGQTNSSTGFTLSPLSGTMTGGVIRVFGYQDA